MKKPSEKNCQSIVKLSYGMSGKMLNVLSLSTNCINCKRCAERHSKANTICSMCYAFKQLEHPNWKNTNMIKAFDYNADALTKKTISTTDAESIAYEIVTACIKNGTDKFRIESFGDIHNVIHAHNYWLICAYVAKLSEVLNYHVCVAWWTKNYDFMCDAFSDLSEDIKAWARKNTSVVLSSVFVNVPISEKIVAYVESILGMKVKTFTVYSEDYITEHNIRINCGSRDCNGCGNCYKKLENDISAEKNVNEKLK